MSRFSVDPGMLGGWVVVDNAAERKGASILTLPTKADAEQVAYVKTAIAAGELTQEDISESLKPKKRWYRAFGTGDIRDRKYTDTVAVTVYDDGYEDVGEDPLNVVLDALNEKLP